MAPARSNGSNNGTSPNNRHNPQPARWEITVSQERRARRAAARPGAQAATFRTAAVRTPVPAIPWTGGLANISQPVRRSPTPTPQPRPRAATAPRSRRSGDIAPDVKPTIIPSNPRGNAQTVQELIALVAHREGSQAPGNASTPTENSRVAPAPASDPPRRRVNPPVRKPPVIFRPYNFTERNKLKILQGLTARSSLFISDAGSTNSPSVDMTARVSSRATDANLATNRSVSNTLPQSISMHSTTATNGTATTASAPAADSNTMQKPNNTTTTTTQLPYRPSPLKRPHNNNETPSKRLRYSAPAALGEGAPNTPLPSPSRANIVQSRVYHQKAVLLQTSQSRAARIARRRTENEIERSSAGGMEGDRDDEEDELEEGGYEEDKVQEGDGEEVDDQELEDGEIEEGNGQELEDGEIAEGDDQELEDGEIKEIKKEDEEE